nr:secretory carrier-associated membrane protein 4 [Ipomoea batatas]
MELAAWEADLKRRERDIKCREDAVDGAGALASDKNWPPVFVSICEETIYQDLDILRASHDSMNIACIYVSRSSRL